MGAPLSVPAAAQSASAPSAALPRPATDSLFRRARRLVSEGKGREGRALVDSLLAAAPEGSPARGDALYWRGALAETAADAERDYRLVIVEYPLSPYADDALLSLAELEQARGERAGALAHLQRYVREHGPGTARGLAALAAARLAFEGHDDVVACTLLADARASAQPTDVELRNQVDYYAGRCRDGTPGEAANRSAATAPAPEVVSPPAGRAAERSTRSAAAPPSRARGARPRPAAPPVAPSEGGLTLQRPDTAAVGGEPRGRFTIQLAAYATRADAERLVRTLAARGVRARVSGRTKPFRVRLGFHATRQSAAAEVAALKARGIISFVTTEPPGRDSVP